MESGRTHLVIFGVSLETQYFEGLADKPTLIFLHEGLGCVEMWRDFPEELSKRTQCPVLVYSRQGYAGSEPCVVPRPLRYMHIEALEVLPELIKVAGIKKHILIGHSDGGSIALINAGGKPSFGLLGVITMAAHVFCEDLSISSIEKAKIAFVEGKLRDGLMKYHHDNTDCAFWGWNKAWLDPEFSHWNIKEYLPNISVQQLVIQGEEDPYGTSAQVKSILNHSKSEVKVCFFENCAHSPHKEKTLESLVLIKNFILDIY